MSKNCTSLVVSLILLAASASAFAQEAKWLAVLRSEATVQQKSAACRELARVGTKQAVPVLAALLGDEKLSHMARYALEPIRDPSVDEALRTALGKLHGRPRLGVIGSLGVRRDTKAIDALGGLLHDPNAATVQAAARALGNIGTPAAATVLEKALAGTSGGNLPAVCEGLLRCAEALQHEGHKQPSQAIYDRLRGLTAAPTQVRAAGLRGAIVARGKDGAGLVAEALRGPDKALAAAAIRAAMELPCMEVINVLVAELPKATAQRQALLIAALSDRHEPRVLGAIIQAARSGDSQLRLAAFRALKRMGDASCAPLLLDAVAEGNPAESLAAREAIESLSDKAVDALLAARLAQAKGNAQIVLIELAGRRHTVAAAPALWLAADDKDSAVRAAALAGLGAVIETADLSKLLARLAAAKDPREAAALDKALDEVCLRASDREAAAARLAEGLPAARGPLKVKLLQTLNSVGGKTALETVAAAARSGDTTLREAAFQVLGKWRSIDAAPALLDLYRTAADGQLKIGAIRGYIRIARQFDMPVDRRAAMCRTALQAAGRDEDKRLVLEILLRYPSAEMRAIAVEAAKIPGLKDEALLVLAGIEHRRGVNRAELGKALAQAGHKPVKLEVIEAHFGAGTQTKDVTAILRRCARNYRIIFLPGEKYNESFGGDPAPGKVKQLKIKYRIDGKEGETSLNEDATIVLPLPR
jgi:HEAT repeat protein